jgi:hypothetical protein
MGLIDFQTALGRMLREQNRDDYLRGVSLAESESRYLENLRDTTEFRFYAGYSGRGALRVLPERPI